MSFNIEYLKDCIVSGIKYVPVTLKMTAIVFVISIIIGFIIATVRFYKVPVLSQIFAAFVTVYLGIPIMLAINVYYLLFSTFYTKIADLLNLSSGLRNANFNIVAYFTLILSTACMVSETFRGAYKGIDKVQFEAGYSIGLSRLRTLTRIVIPQIVPIVLPSMINWLSGSLKNMSMVFVIGIYEIMNGALIPCIKTYSYVEGYVAAALIYWALVVIIEQAGKLAERRSVRYRRQGT